MARRTDNQDTKSSKRPAQTLDLEAEEVKKASKGSEGSEKKSSESKSQDTQQKDQKQEKTAKKEDVKTKEPLAGEKKQSSDGGSFFKTLAASGSTAP